MDALYLIEIIMCILSFILLPLNPVKYEVASFDLFLLF